MKRNKLNAKEGRRTRRKGQTGSRYHEKRVRQENDPTLSASGLRPSTRKRIAAHAMSIASASRSEG